MVYFIKQSFLDGRLDNLDVGQVDVRGVVLNGPPDTATSRRSFPFTKTGTKGSLGIFDLKNSN